MLNNMPLEYIPSTAGLVCQVPSLAATLTGTGCLFPPPPAPMHNHDTSTADINEDAAACHGHTMYQANQLN